jgi:glycosyltransferase involved in cell wall biosynthesis
LPELTLLVHLARQEPLGRVLLEAAASGCCIVASNVGGTSEIFPFNEHAAYLIQPDAQAAIQAIRELLQNASKRQQMGTMARRRAAAVFRDCDRARGLLRHYDALR